MNLTMGGGNEEIRRRRHLRGWSQEDLADRLHEAATALGVSPGEIDRHSVSRWERGVRHPRPTNVQLLAQVFQAEPADLGLVEPDLKRRDFLRLGAGLALSGPVAEAADLLALMEGGGAVVDDAEAAVLRLRRAYSRTPTDVLMADVRARLAAVRQILQGRLDPAQRRDLTASAGWLALLLATVCFDADEREAGWSYRKVALEIARDLGHAELLAWSWETAAWVALSSGRFLDSVDYAQAGLQVAPSSSPMVALHLQVARASARMGDASATLAALRSGGAVLERLPEPEHRDDHYSFDSGKLHFYAATSLSLLGLAGEAEREARTVIATQSDPASLNWWPRRVSVAHADLGHALAQRGEIDEAATEGLIALDNTLLPLHGTAVKRARELGKVLAGYEDVEQVRVFRDRLEAV